MRCKPTSRLAPHSSSVLRSERVKAKPCGRAARGLDPNTTCGPPTTKTAAKEGCPRACAQPECASRQKPLATRRPIFFIYPQALGASSKNAPAYDGWSSGPIIYAYVDGNPVSMVDPTGEFGIPGALGAAGFNFGTQFLTNLYLSDGDWRRALKCVDFGDVLISGALGFVGPSFLSNVLGGKAGPAGLTAAQNRQIYFTKSLPAGFFLKKGSPPLRAGDDCECQGLSLGNLLGAFAH
jgi:hypothetical protein